MLENHKIISYEDNIKDLPDYPSDAGYTAAQLKAMFDARSDKEIKEKFNGLVDELVSLLTQVEENISVNEERITGVGEDLGAHRGSEYAHLELFEKVKQELTERINAVSSTVAEHNEDADAHADIRGLVSDIARRLNALANSDDITLDQLSEIVAYIKTNREILEIVTQGKVGKEELLQTLSEYIKKSEFSTELIQNTIQENKGTGAYTEEEQKFPISTGIFDKFMMTIGREIDTLFLRCDALDSQVGDFDAALDTAIAICDSYIGGETE